MHCLCSSWFEAKFQPQAWDVGKNPIVCKLGPGNASWFKVFTHCLRPLLPEKAARARLKKGEEFFKTACDRGARIIS